MYDLLIRGGEVYDPRSNTHQVLDIAVSKGKIAAVWPDIDPASAQQVFDAVFDAKVRFD